MIKKIIFFFLFFSLPVFAIDDVVDCPSTSINIQASTPTSQFDFDPNSGDVVTDKKTGLMWTRCPLNYQWGLTCVIDSGSFGRISWESALTKASETMGTPYLGFSDWRVPNIKELASIVERKCAGFAINKGVFSGVAPGVYWSNTHIGDAIRVINMGSSGQVTAQSPTDSAYVRLVRDCQSFVAGECLD